jgi:thiol:disulfide interchange protein
MTLLRALLPALLLLLALPAARGAEGAAAKALWYEKLDDAVAASAKSGKPILADFTGSDWCHWCKLLKAEVFDTPEFATWAAKTVVLL